MAADSTVGIRSKSRQREYLPSDRDIEFLSVDLRDKQAAQVAFERLTDITHIAYTALHEKPELVAGWSSKEQILLVTLTFLGPHCLLKVARHRWLCRWVSRSKSKRPFCRHRPAQSHLGRSWRGRLPGTRSPRQSPLARPGGLRVLAPRAAAARPRPLQPCLRSGSVRG